MKAWVVYESIFGNTKEIAEAIGQGLSKSYDAEVVEVGAAGNPAGVDLVVVGGPTHMLTMTRPMTRRMGREQAAKVHIAPVSGDMGIREWIDGLPFRQGATAATFDTGAGRMGLFSGGSAAKAAATRLTRKGYRITVRPEQFLISADGDHQVLRPGERERARQWGERLAERAAAG